MSNVPEASMASVAPAAVDAEPADRWRHACWLAPLSLYVVTRCFSGFSDLLVTADACKYLALGRSFPFHHVDNDSIFLLHPPVVGWVIGVLAVALPLAVAGIAATVLTGVGNFAATWALGRATGLSRAALMGGLLFLCLDTNLVYYESTITRIPAMLLSFTLALLAFERWLRGARHGLALALGANLLAHLVSDQALALLPCQAVLFWLNDHGRSRRQGLLFAAATAGIFLAWPLVRLAVYLTHDHFPAGIDGTIEATRPLPLAGLLQPNLLPLTQAHVQTTAGMGLSLAKLDLFRLIERPTLLLLIPRPAAAVGVGLLTLLAFARRERRRQALKWLLLSVLLFLPSAMGLLPWYGMAFVAPFSLLMAEGFETIVARRRAARLGVTALLLVAVVGASVFWLRPRAPRPQHFNGVMPGARFILSRPATTDGLSVAQALARMPNVRGVMAPVGFTPQLIYLANRRTVALPFDPALIDAYIRAYDITHIVLESRHAFPPPGASPATLRYTSVDAGRYVLAHPEKFRPLATTEEATQLGPMKFVVLEVAR